MNLLKKYLAPLSGLYNQFFIAILGFIIVIFYLYRRDKKTKALALLEAKYNALQETHHQSKIDRANYENSEYLLQNDKNENNLSEHDVVVDRLQRSGNLRND